MKKSLPLFAIITLLFVIAAWFSVSQRTPGTTVEKAPLYPELAGKIQDVARVEIKSAEESTVLSAKGDQWVLENRGGYPAFFSRIKPLVIAISKLEIREAKTANPDLYSRLQVEDVSAEKAKSNLVTLLDAEGKTLASLLIGKERVNRTDGSTNSLYVRKAGEEQSYLAKGAIMLSANPADWLENSLIDLSSDRLKSITIDHGGDKTVQAIREEKGSENYQLQNIPEGFKVKSQATMNSLASAVEELHFDDVNNAADFKWPAETLVTEYETFDGLVASIKSAKIEDQTWAEFSFKFIGKEEPVKPTEDDQNQMPSVKQQAEMLNAKTEGWVYALPKFKAKMLTRSLDKLINESSDEAAPAAQTPKPPQGMSMDDLPPGITPDMLKEMMSPAGATQKK